MALTMAEKLVTSFLFKRLSFNLLQSLKLSTTQIPNSSPPSTSATTSESITKWKRNKKKKKKKKMEEKNLIEAAKYLPKCGVGCHMASSDLTNVTYEITRINVCKDGRHGRAWGIAYKDGLPAPFPSKIGGVLKPCWKHIKNPLKLEAPKLFESIPDPLRLEEPEPDESIPDPLKLEEPEPDESIIPDPPKLEAPKPDAAQEA